MHSQLLAAVEDLECDKAIIRNQSSIGNWRQVPARSLKYNIHLAICILYEKTNAFLVFGKLKLTYLIRGKQHSSNFLVSFYIFCLLRLVTTLINTFTLYRLGHYIIMVGMGGTSTPFHFNVPRNSRFSHDVTKIQTKKLSLLLSFYFHVILEHLKTFTQTNFRFKRDFVLRYRTLEFPGFCVTHHLAGGRESSYVG